MITKDYLERILKELSKKRPAFCSEADFKFELANSIREELQSSKYKDDFNIFLEYYIEIENTPIYIDIMVKIKNKYYPVELKYKTKKDNCQLTNNEEIILKDHAAHDINCNKYLCDIERIEAIQNKIKDKFGSGYAIMLTNDYVYWNGPNPHCNYYKFRIKDGDKIPGNKDLTWKINTSQNTIKACKEKIRLKKDYEIHWDYYNKKENSSLPFKFLIIEIK